MMQNVGYTSSIYTYQEEEHPDWTGDIGLGLRTSAIAANRLILQAEDLPIYSFYLKNKEFRTWSNRFEAAAYSYIGPFNMKGGFRQHDLYQRPQLEFSRPYHYSDSEWSTEVDIGKLSSIFVTAYASFNKLNYEEDPYFGNYNLAERLNHREDTVGLRLNKPVFTGTVIYADYERTSYKFEQSPDRNTKAQQLGVGVQFPEIGALQGNFRIGIKRFEPSNPLYMDTQRANGRGDVRFTLADRVRLNVFYEIATRFSYSASDTFYDDYSLGGGTEVYLTRFLKAGGSYRDGRLKYYSFIDLERKRNDRIRQQQYFLAVPFIGRTSIGLSYNVYHLTSDVLKLDYSRSYWGGFLSYEF